jgi:hypothetical protein
MQTNTESVGQEDEPLDSEQPDETVNDAENALVISKAAARISRAFHLYLGSIVLVLMVLAAIAVAVAGCWKRSQNINVSGKSTTPLSTISQSVVPTHSGFGLIEERVGNTTRIIVKKLDPEASWLLVSRDELTATHPVLAPDTTYVAYRQGDAGDKNLVIVSLTDDTRLTLTAGRIRRAGETVGLEALYLCEELSTVAWDSDSSRVAFFGCETNTLSSVVLIGNLAKLHTPTVITASYVATNTNRQLNWLGQDQLEVDMPSTDLQQGSTTAIFDIP